jgi:hypothetical protein
VPTRHPEDLVLVDHAEFLKKRWRLEQPTGPDLVQVVELRGPG